MGKRVNGYWTKHALDRGILAVAVDDEENERLAFLKVIRTINGEGVRGFFSAQAGKDFFTDRDEAIAAAKAMAARKVASLEKQLAKVRKLADEPKWAKD